MKKMTRPALFWPLCLKTTVLTTALLGLASTSFAAPPKQSTLAAPSDTTVTTKARPKIKCEKPSALVTKRTPDEIVSSCNVADKNGAYIIKHGELRMQKRGSKFYHTIGNYFADKKHGMWEYFYPDSDKIWIRGQYEGGEGSGDWTVYNEQGIETFFGSWAKFRIMRKKEQPNNGNWEFFWKPRRR